MTPPTPSLHDAGAMSDAELHRGAEDLLRKRLAPFDAELQRLPEFSDTCAVLRSGGRALVVRILVRTGPHVRGRTTGRLGMHWMLRSDIEDIVALVDRNRQKVWLMPSVEFRKRASPQRDGRWHLDWLLEPSPRSRWPEEGDMEAYLVENCAARLLEMEKTKA